MFKLTIDRAVLRTALAHLKFGHLTRGCALPVLYGIKVTMHPVGTVSLTTSDLEITTTFDPTIGAGCTVAGEPGTVVVPWADLKGASTGKGDVVLETGEGDVVTILAGGMQSTVRCLPADEYPRLADASEIQHGTIAVAPFADVIGAASADGARPILTGVYVDGTRVVATDSYRLHLCDRPASDIVDGASGHATTTARLIEGEFPNYRGLVPDAANLPVQMRVDRTDEMATAMRNAAKNYSRNTPIRLEMVDGAIVGRMVEHDRGETVLPMTGWSMVAGEPIGAAFNPHYLADLLAGSDGAVFGCTDTQKPALLTGEGGRTRLVMPVRVS